MKKQRKKLGTKNVECEAEKNRLRQKKQQDTYKMKQRKQVERGRQS